MHNFQSLLFLSMPLAVAPDRNPDNHIEPFMALRYPANLTTLV
jgi:hypothetical protein